MAEHTIWRGQIPKIHRPTFALCYSTHPHEEIPKRMIQRCPRNSNRKREKGKGTHRKMRKPEKERATRQNKRGKVKQMAKIFVFKCSKPRVDKMKRHFVMRTQRANDTCRKMKRTAPSPFNASIDFRPHASRKRYVHKYAPKTCRYFVRRPK